MADERDRFLPGKLPSEFLAKLLQQNQITDERVLVGPQVGADAAAIDMGESVLVVKTDPITFPARDSGRYLVNINANDVACMGAEPRWLLVTTLLPETKSTPALVQELFDSLSGAARDLDISLIGGHTEITIGLDRPILIGQMLGETNKDRLYDLRSSQPGDAILLCNGIAIEGTSILANEADQTAFESLPDDIMIPASRFVQRPGISIVPAARALRESGATIRGLHDPTEGGLVTALHELADITGLGVAVDRRAIVVYPETDAICTALGLDPLGLIASGALLAVISEETVDQALATLDDAGMLATRIGTMESGPESWLIEDGERHPLPSFAVDEIARYFSENEPGE